MALPNPGMNFTPFDTLPASDLNDIVENVESLSTGSGFVLGNNVIPANALATNALTLGYAQSTSNLTNASTSDADVTSVSVTVTVPAGGRRIKITGFATSVLNVSGGNVVYLKIKEGVNVLAYTKCNAPNSTFTTIGTPIASFVATAGAHTYKLSTANDIATDVTLVGSATSPIFILVELM